MSDPQTAEIRALYEAFVHVAGPAPGCETVEDTLAFVLGTFIAHTSSDKFDLLLRLQKAVGLMVTGARLEGTSAVTISPDSGDAN